MDPERLAHELWPGRVERVEVLGGGITNRNFTVALDDGQVLVLRIGGEDTELLGIDRHVEHEANRAAASVGIAPEVVQFVEPQGYLVTRFVGGAPIPIERVHEPRTLAEIARTLRSFHDQPSISGRFDSFRVVETYAAIATQRGVAVPAAYAHAREIALRIEDERGAQPLAPCHNDLLNANLIHDGRRLWIVDWEYAGMGDRFFDLANFAINHELGPRDVEALLDAYFGSVRDDDLRALQLMRFMSDFREAMWGVVQQAISKLDFDFAQYARDHFARLERTAESDEFRQALAA